jgi:hypothetical protein
MKNQISKIGNHKKQMRIQEIFIMEHSAQKWIFDKLIHERQYIYRLFVQLQNNMNMKKLNVEKQMRSKNTIEFAIKFTVNQPKQLKNKLLKNQSKKLKRKLLKNNMVI